MYMYLQSYINVIHIYKRRHQQALKPTLLTTTEELSTASCCQAVIFSGMSQNGFTVHHIFTVAVYTYTYIHIGTFHTIAGLDSWNAFPSLVLMAYGLEFIYTCMISSHLMYVVHCQVLAHLPTSNTYILASTYNCIDKLTCILTQGIM